MVGYDPRKKDLTNNQIFIASTASSIISRFLLQPIDVIKIRLQVGKKNSYSYSMKNNSYDICI